MVDLNAIREIYRNRAGGRQVSPPPPPQPTGAQGGAAAIWIALVVLSAAGVLALAALQFLGSQADMGRPTNADQPVRSQPQPQPQPHPHQDLDLEDPAAADPSEPDDPVLSDPPARLAIREAVLGTGFKDGLVTGSTNRANPVFESPAEVVAAASFEGANVAVDRLAIRFISESGEIRECPAQTLREATGIIACRAPDLPEGSYRFEILLNQSVLRGLPFQISDWNRIQSIVRFGQVAARVDTGAPLGSGDVGLVGPASPAGLYLEYQKARTTDVISVRLLRGSQYLNACQDFVIQDHEGSYGCQFQGVVVGDYEFAVFVNQHQVARYPFSVRDLRIADPQWKRAVDPDRVARETPAAALRSGIQGSAELDCVALFDGSLDCETVKETPEGLHFGDAAIRAVKTARLETQTPDGRSIVGGRLTLIINFPKPDFRH